MAQGPQTAEGGGAAPVTQPSLHITAPPSTGSTTTTTMPASATSAAPPGDVQALINSFGFDLSAWMKQNPELAKTLGWA